MEEKELLVTGAQQLGVELTEEQIDKFIDYLEILQEWNQKMNLTALDTAREIIVKHFLDSLTCLVELDLTGREKVIDVGTGAGFPGVPLKIIYPQLKLTLLDSLRKRTNFLKQLCYKLNLEGIEFIHGRAEDYGQDQNYREQYDYVVARAVASLNILVEYTLPFARINGRLIAQKGSEAEQEVIESQQAVQSLGGAIFDLRKVNLPYSEAERHLVVIDKMAQTPVQYPRRAGKPKKSPL
ncbi:16S rRNA (guanine(527)-N(7))-methyltransferase RsmG [Natroniella acetigena]|uniref:16S rRNA (guanine(527)-N(7))-methyltransferase RsmG n=1 Tax=Natroniella acetigena TaxID=52004 RepID=UPI00200AC7E3|nr:16S rRNA (guanine(527)-N(7))-methyltransferase RsmG [Natroniella acetigena]MCK8826844.1 16S rRNA (guanine(527)-N(7))-methyltransferase RsmG [Natroniella acetigena]